MRVIIRIVTMFTIKKLIELLFFDSLLVDNFNAILCYEEKYIYL